MMLGRSVREFRFVHVEFEMPVGYPREEAQHALGYLYLMLKR